MKSRIHDSMPEFSFLGEDGYTICIPMWFEIFFGTKRNIIINQEEQNQTPVIQGGWLWSSHSKFLSPQKPRSLNEQWAALLLEVKQKSWYYSLWYYPYQDFFFLKKEHIFYPHKP